MYQLPSASDQFAAALSAPIPFALAVFVVGVALWGLIRWLYQWRYDGVIEMKDAMIRLAAEENRTQKAKHADSEAMAKKLTEDLASAEKKLEEFVKIKGAEGAPDFQPLIQDLLKLSLAVESAGKANTAVDEALRRGAASTTLPSGG